MRNGECPREAELLESLCGALPDSWPDHLRVHVERCPSCAALAAVVPPLRDECLASMRAASVPSPAIVWWRIRLRARREAAARALRPIAATQAITLACAVGVLAAVVGLVAPGASTVDGWLGAIRKGAEAAGAAAVPSTMAQLLSPGGIAFGLAGALLLVIAPVAIYFALSDR